MTVPFIDLKAQYETIRSEIQDAINSVLLDGNFILGPEVGKFEQEIAEYLGVAHGIGVASGTDALLLSLRALGIGPGDEVIVPAFTFFATAEVVLLLGAKPVFVDVDPKTYCIDVKQLEGQVNPRTRAIIPVHLFGHAADMGAILEISNKHGLKIVEDNAQAVGAMFGRQKTGAIGDVGCFSFYPTKNLAAYGDGGMIVTEDAAFADKIRVLRTHGWHQKYYPEVVGYNSRLDEIQAAVLRIKLSHLDDWNQCRRDLASLYSKNLQGLSLQLPQEELNTKHVYHMYVVEVDSREEVRKRLSNDGIATAVYYPYPLHLVPALQELGYRNGDFPVSESASKRCLALPLFPEMTENQVKEVAEALRMAMSSI